MSRVVKKIIEKKPKRKTSSRERESIEKISYKPRSSSIPTNNDERPENIQTDGMDRDRNCT